jgi:hypothetical protein
MARKFVLKPFCRCNAKCTEKNRTNVILRLTAKKKLK